MGGSDTQTVGQYAGPKPVGGTRGTDQAPLAGPTSPDPLFTLAAHLA